MAEYVNVSIPPILHELVLVNRRHPRQALHEVIEAALVHWVRHGAWGCEPCAEAVREQVAA